MVKDTHSPPSIEPKFKYKDKVIITKKFYKGAQGTVVECDKQKFKGNPYKYIYRVHFPSGYPSNFTIWFPENYMELGK